MTDDQTKNIQLILDDKLSEADKEHYQSIFGSLPPLEENRLNIMAVEIRMNQPNKILVTSIIRSTVKEEIKLKESTLSLVNEKMDLISEKIENFKNLEAIQPNTAQLYQIEFPNKKEIVYDFQEIKNWSLVFSKNLIHRVDFSDLDESKIPESTREYLQNIANEIPLTENELSFIGFSAQLDNQKNLHLNLLIRNGSNDSLDIKQLPLKFFDASGDLLAQGTFKMGGVTVLANTSKPISLVFPAKSILKDNIDLTTWSVQHIEA